MAKDKMQAYQRSMIESLVKRKSVTKTSNVYKTNQQINISTMSRWSAKYSGGYQSLHSRRIFDPVVGKYLSIESNQPWYEWLMGKTQTHKKKQIIRRSAIKELHQRLGMIIMLQSEDPQMTLGVGYYNLEGYINLSTMMYEIVERFLNVSKATRYEVL